MMKKYLWTFPLLSGVITIIGVLTPVATFFNEINIWIWGLIDGKYFGFNLEFIENQLILYMGIIISIIIGVISIILIITACLFHNGYFEEKRITKLWIIIGGIILTSIIIHLVALDYYNFRGLLPYGIWELFDAGFGAIGPIIGSILTMGSGITMLIMEKQRQASQPPKIKLPKNIPKSICPHCGRALSLNAKFCRECGKSI